MNFCESQFINQQEEYTPGVYNYLKYPHFCGWSHVVCMHFQFLVTIKKCFLQRFPSCVNLLMTVKR